MFQDVEDGLRISAAGRGNLVDRKGSAGVLFEMSDDAPLQTEDIAGHLLAGLDTGLMVGVHVDKRGIESDGTLIKGDEGAQGPDVESIDCYRKGVASALRKGVPCSLKECVETITARDAVLDLWRCAFAVFQDLDKGDEEIVHAIAELLDIGMLVRGALVSIYGDTLVDDSAGKIFFFTERFHDKLLKIPREELKTVLIGKYHHVLGAIAVSSVVPH
jgi:hypothetical protein